MKYVVTIVDTATGKVSYGDIPTTKSHARRWANQYIKDGFEADIAPVDDVSDVSGREIKSAFESEKRHRWDQVKVRFSWRNMEGEVVGACLSVQELYMDWYGECESCPENDTPIYDIQVGTTVIPNEAVENFRFEELMALIEQTWPRLKRGRPSNPSKQMAGKLAIPGRKRGRPSKEERNRMKLGFGRR